MSPGPSAEAEATNTDQHRTACEPGPTEGVSTLGTIGEQKIGAQFEVESSGVDGHWTLA